MPKLSSILALFLALPCAAQEAAAPASAAPTPTLFGFLSDSETALRLKAPGSAGVKDVLRVMGEIRQEGLRQAPENRDAVAQNGLPRINDSAAALGAANASAPDAQAVDDAVAALDNHAGDFSHAVTFSDRAIGRDPSDEQAWVNRSNAGFGLERYVSALADAERALALDERDGQAYRARALAEYGLKRTSEAAQDARRALAIDPNDRTAFFILELAQGKGRTLDLAGLRPRAPSSAASSVTPTPDSSAPSDTAQSGGTALADVLVQSAARKLAVQDFAGAIDDADKALAEDPNNTAAYYYRAAAHNLAGDYVAAAADASHAIAINPHDAAARDTRAWAFNRMGRYRDAIADSNHSLEINPQNPYAFANLGYAYEQMGDVASMLRDLKAAADMNAQFAPAYHEAAQRYGVETETAGASRQAPGNAKARSFLAILASSLIGGLLIALGVVHVMEEAPKPAIVAAGPAPTPVLGGLEGYVLGRKLGMGGMGIVYEAYDRMLERPVAIKRIREELRADPHLRRRLLQEARTVASLHHPGIIDIHSVIEDRSGLYLVFELLEGKTVADLLADRGRLSLAECKKILGPVCEALDFAHRHLVVHRDLKPANIMITQDGPVKVLDFGISRQAQPRLASLDPADGRTGTPQYMAPEQERGLVRPESDVFSLGTCLYEMLTGRYPFPEPDGSRKTALDYARPSQTDPSLPRELDAFLDAVLAPDPEKRIPSAMEFWRRLDGISVRALDAAA